MWDDVTVGVSYSRPFEIFLIKDLFEKIDCEPGQPVTCDVEGEVIHGKAELYGALNPEEELQSLVLTAVDSVEYLIEHDEKFETFFDFETGRIDVDDSEKLMDLISILQNKNTRNATNDILIGAYLLARTSVVDSFEDPEYIWNPYIYLAGETFAQIYSKDRFELEALENYRGTVEEVDQAHFCPRDISPTDDETQRLEEHVNSVKFFAPNPQNQLTTRNMAAHGPLPTPDLLDQLNRDEEKRTPLLLDLGEATIEIDSSKFGNFHIPSARDQNLDWNHFQELTREVLNPEPEEVTEDFIFFKGSPESVQFTKDSESSIQYGFIHDVEGKIEGKVLPNLKSALNDYYDVDIHQTGPFIPDHLGMKDSCRKWIFDTNAIYLQDSTNEPRHVFNYLVNNYHFFDSEIIIPWHSIYEINSHDVSDASGPSKKTIDRGVDNLRSLKILDTIDFIDLDMDDIPNERNKSDAKVSPLLDISILGLAEDIDAGIVSADNRLLEIAEIRDIFCEDIKDYVESILEGPSVKEQQKEELLENMEDDLISYDEAVGNAQRGIEQDLNLHPESTRDEEDIADEIVSDLVKSEVLIMCPLDGELILGRAQHLTVVPTRSFVQNLSSYVVEFNGDDYLDFSFLDDVRKQTGRSGGDLPYIEFLIPSTYVTQSLTEPPSGLSTGDLISKIVSNFISSQEGITGFQRKLYEISHLRNARYQSYNYSSSRFDEYSLLEVCNQRDAALLCPQSEVFLQRLATLLETKVILC